MRSHHASLTRLTRNRRPPEPARPPAQHTLTELGTHTLRVSVSYQGEGGGEPKSLRKFYRFNVLSPLQLTATVTEAPGPAVIVASQPGRAAAFVAATLRNTTSSDLLLEVLFVRARRREREREKERERERE